MYTTADLIAATNALAGNTTATLAAPAAALPLVQYLTPDQWAGVTNGMSPDGLAALAALASSQGGLTPAGLGANAPGPVGNLIESDGKTLSGVSLTANNFPGTWADGSN